MADPIRIAIDARYWRASIQTGVERYIHLLLEALAAAPEPVEVGLVLLAGQAGAFTPPPGARVRALSVATRREESLHRAVEVFDADLVHYPFALPARLARPAVFTLHDAGRYKFPDQMVRAVREVQNPRLKQHLDDPRLRSVITVSQAARRDIIEALGALPCPLDVVPNYVSADLRRRLREPRRELAPAEPFLFGVGVFMPSKNIPRLVEAFRLARRREPDLVPRRLLLAGRRGWERALPAASQDVEVLGHVQEDLLAALFACAKAFVFPTLYEGFGIPAQEALVAGTPLLCSDIEVLREVTGGLATFADPCDNDALASGIIEACAAPPPGGDAVNALLSEYSAPAVGRTLLEAYRAAAAGR